MVVIQIWRNAARCNIFENLFWIHASKILVCCDKEHITLNLHGKNKIVIHDLHGGTFGGYQIFFKVQ